MPGCVGGASPYLATLDRCRAWMRVQVDANDGWAICATVAARCANSVGERAQPALLMQTLRWQGEQRMRKFPVLLNTAQAAAALGLSPRTLKRYRLGGGGAQFRRIGRRVCHLHLDLERWLDSRVREWTSDDGCETEEEEE